MRRMSFCSIPRFFMVEFHRRHYEFVKIAKYLLKCMVHGLITNSLVRNLKIIVSKHDRFRSLKRAFHEMFRSQLLLRKRLRDFCYKIVTNVIPHFLSISF